MTGTPTWLTGLWALYMAYTLHAIRGQLSSIIRIMLDRMY